MTSMPCPTVASAPVRLPTYLRAVVTEACPMRCPYCHAEGEDATADGGVVKRAQRLSRSELEECLLLAVAQGIQKLKLLGGEPLARRDLPDVIRSLRSAGVTADISLITSGAVPPERMAVALEAGLDRANLSVHGWTVEAFSRRGGTARLLGFRNANLDLLVDAGRPLKVNYVYTGRDCERDLGELLAWAAERPLVVAVLDDLHDPQASSSVPVQAVRRLRGPWSCSTADADPHSLETTHLHWPDGLRVEIKSSQLGQLAPWGSCVGCPAREQCREGIYALRLGPTGDLRLCMDRHDLSLPLGRIVREQGSVLAAHAWNDFLKEHIACR